MKPDATCKWYKDAQPVLGPTLFDQNLRSAKFDSNASIELNLVPHAAHLHVLGMVLIL